MDTIQECNFFFPIDFPAIIKNIRKSPGGDLFAYALKIRRVSFPKITSNTESYIFHADLFSQLMKRINQHMQTLLGTYSGEITNRKRQWIWLYIAFPMPI